MTEDASISVRELMARFRGGDRAAMDALVAHLYPELHRIAAGKMGQERREHTWTPTVLVNELYLELVKIKALRDSSAVGSDRDSFLGLAAHIMRRLLIHHSRPLSRKADKVGYEDVGFLLPDTSQPAADALAEIENLLQRLMQIDPKLRTVVELRIFAGKTADEAAAEMQCSPRSVHKFWSFARRWLAAELID